MWLLRNKYIFLATLCSLLLAQNLSVQANVKTKQKPHNTRQSQEPVYLSGVVNFEPPAENGDPQATAAGGSRSSCPPSLVSQSADNATSPLTALLPQTTSKTLTIKSSPTFFVYVPPTSASTIFFQLKDSQDKLVYQDIMPISAERGKIIDIKMADNSPSLDLNQDYQWSVFLLCRYDSASVTQDITSLDESYDLMNEPWVVGEITRIDTPEPINQVSNGTPSLDLANKYAQNGLWFETLATLHQMIQKKPQQEELQRIWQDLLQSQGIEATIAQTGLQ